MTGPQSPAVAASPSAELSRRQDAAGDVPSGSAEPVTGATSPAALTGWHGRHGKGAAKKRSETKRLEAIVRHSQPLPQAVPPNPTRNSSEPRHIHGKDDGARLPKGILAMDRESYLVQRLRKPHGPIFGMKDNPFSFGGGLVNGGLSSEAMDLLRGIFSFDYMGSAEFEWGSVPKALQRLAGAKLTAFVADVDLSTVPPSWRERRAAPMQGTALVYVLCPKDFADVVADRVAAFAARKGRTKEYVGLDQALRPADECDRDLRGWLEIDNGYFFFVDREMWEKTCGLFGVAVPTEAVSS